MTTNTSGQEGLAQDKYGFTLKWSVDEPLLAVQPVWPQDKITQDENASCDTLIRTTMEKIQHNLESCNDFRQNNIQHFMAKVTEEVNRDKNDSDRFDQNTFWIIRFRLSIVIPGRSFRLDSGIWRRFSSLSDMIHVSDDYTLAVRLDIGKCQRGTEFRNDQSLLNHVLPSSRNMEYFQIGTVQNDQLKDGEIGMLDTTKDEKPVDRKNVILARYEDIHRPERMSDNFVILNTWRFVQPDGTSYFQKIGDPEGGMVRDLAFLNRKNVKVSTTWQKNGKNPSLKDLKDDIADKRGKHTDKQKAAAKADVPRLPQMTLRRFPAAQLNDPSNVLKDGVKVRAVVRVVYMLPELGLDDKAKRSPQNCYFDDIDKKATFRNMATMMFGGTDAHKVNNRIAPAVSRIKTKHVWWIMDPRKKGDFAKMYHVDDANRPVCKYIPDAPNENGKNCVLYTECHVRDLNAPDDYNADGI